MLVGAALPLAQAALTLSRKRRSSASPSDSRNLWIALEIARRLWSRRVTLLPYDFAYAGCPALITTLSPSTHASSTRCGTSAKAILGTRCTVKPPVVGPGAPAGGPGSVWVSCPTGCGRARSVPLAGVPTVNGLPVSPWLDLPVRTTPRRADPLLGARTPKNPANSGISRKILLSSFSSLAASRALMS